MKKRTLSLLLALLMVIGLLPVTARAGELDNGLLYEIYDDHVEITGYTGKPTEIVIPAEIEGLPVTVIGNSAFYRCRNLTSISIPDTVTSIGEDAFAVCSSLPSISLPSNITQIADSTFTFCSSLTNISIPGSVTSIGDTAFSFCESLTNISIPDSVTSIGDGAFQYCSALTSISIPNGVTYIGSCAFSYCISLTSISLPDGISYIDHSMFYSCESLTSIIIPDGVTYIGIEAFCACASLKSISIPNSVTAIYGGAFEYCSNLTSIYFKGDAPKFEPTVEGDIFSNVTATAYYPANNPTWTADVMQNYSGKITWVPYTPNPFTDVTASDFYYIPVLWALENGITSGTTPTEFSPYDSCLRSQVVTFLWRAAGEPKAKSAVNPFVDVKPTDYYYDAVLWAVEQGITTGADSTHFEPNGVCNRSQVVTFLYRAFGKPPVDSAENPFTDVSAGDWYASAVLWAVQEGITNGLSDTQFGPNEVCDRSQVVTFLYRAYN